MIWFPRCVGRWLLLLSSLSLASVVLASPHLALADAWTAPRAVTSLEFAPAILADLGLELVASEPSAESEAFAGMSFRTREGSSLEFRAPKGDFERFDAGELHHVGGFTLQIVSSAERIDLSGFVLQVSAQPDDFALLDDSGQRFFVLRDMQFTTSWVEQELQLLNVSIHLAPELADRLARPDLAFAFVGTANLALPALLPAELAPTAAGGGAGGACIETKGPIDVELTGIDSVSQLAREAGVRVALASNARLENVGTGSVEWYEAIEPLQFGGGAVGPHPFLSLSMTRLASDGRLVQLGLGDVKHAFRALNSGCPCASGAILYPGCGDVYGVSTNANRRYLAPRDGVNAYTSTWQRVGSHFDQCLAIETPSCNPATDDDDDFRDHEGNTPLGSYHDEFDHLLVVPESGLQEPGATYFVEAWYLVAGDVDIFNSMGRRTVVPVLSGSTWSFGFGDAGLEAVAQTC